MIWPNAADDTSRGTADMCPSFGLRDTPYLRPRCAVVTRRGRGNPQGRRDQVPGRQHDLVTDAGEVIRIRSKAADGDALQSPRVWVGGCAWALIRSATAGYSGYSRVLTGSPFEKGGPTADSSVEGASPFLTVGAACIPKIGVRWIEHSSPTCRNRRRRAAARLSC
jgi:hypothetical protein